MKTARKLMSLLLVLALVTAWMPAQALAITTEHTDQVDMIPKIEKTRIVYFNPLYPTPDETTVSQWAKSGIRPASEEDPVYAQSLQEAAAVLRKGMVQRQNQIVVYYMFQEDQHESYDFVYDIFNEAIIHTGDPQEGDALQWVYQGWEVNMQQTFDGEYYRYEIFYTIGYYTDAQQEAELDAAVDALLDSFGFTDSTSDYDKVKQIYDYVCANVTYDYANLNDSTYTLQFTAYAALLHGTAVCQGYALLMYRLLLEEGIDCRLIGSIPEECHAWNIVKLGDYYYNFDSTWDAGQPQYTWFLLSQADFVDHTRSRAFTTEEFHAQYPMDPVSYDPGSAHTHTYDAGVVTAPTCTEGGYTTYTCTVCGNSYQDEWTDLRPHSYDEGVVTAPTCTEYGYTTYTCTVCGEIGTDHYVDPVPHEYATVVTPPSCDAAGYTTYTCVMCGVFYADDYVPESHDYAEEVKAGTCTDFGYTTRTCTLCGDVWRYDYVNPPGHVLGEDFLCTVCGRPEYVLHSNLMLKDLVVDENGVYYTAYGDMVMVAVSLQLDQWTVDFSLANQVNGIGEIHYSLTYWEQILSATNEDGCMVLTTESLAWMLDLLQGDSVSGLEDWGLRYYLCYVLDHNHEFETVTTPPTCDDFGVIEEICIHCGLVSESEWTPTAHSYDEGVVTPATCTSNGYTTYTCTICGDYYQTDYTPFADHTYGDEGVVTTPTCTTEGYTTYTCTQCDNQIHRDYIAPNDHAPDETCVCTVCGTKVYLVDIGLELEMLVLGEDGVYYTPYGDPVVIAISAPLDNWLGGYSLYECVQQFGSYYFSMTYWKQLLAATNADGYAPLTSETLVWMLDLITVNPAWEEDETCLTHYLAFPVDHAHTYEVYEEAPTCAQTGVIVHTCSQCGISQWEYTDPLGHSLDENYVCVVCGVKFDYMVDCGLTLEDLLLGDNGTYYTADGHVAVIAVSAPLEFWLGGNSLADYVYVFGNAYFSLTYWDQLLAATNADGYAPLTVETLAWILDLITGNPAWEEDATYLTHYIGFTLKCSHSYEPVVTEPTCNAQGYTTYTCTACGDSYVDAYTDIVDHNYVDGVCAYCGAEAENKALLGDVNGDGKINTTDARLIMQYTLDLVDETGLDLAAADVNGDGKVSTTDARLIMQKALGLIAQFPIVGE